MQRAENDQINKLMAGHKVRHVKKRQIIYYEGDTVNGIYMVLSGNVKTIKIAEDGKELLTGMYGPKSYFGMAAMFSGKQYRETAEATEDTDLSLLPRELVEELLSRYPDVSVRFMQMLANNLLATQEQLLHLAYHSVRKRLAAVLLNLMKDNSDRIIVSRDNLAAMAGVAIETVSRILSDFKEEHLIKRKGSQIVILEPLKLQYIKN